MIETGGLHLQMITENWEFKKPSELCHVLYFADFSKTELANITFTQLDLLNMIFFFISDMMNKKKLIEQGIVEWSASNQFEVSLKTIAQMVGKGNTSHYKIIVQNLEALAKIQLFTNTLKKNKENEQLLFYSIRRVDCLHNYDVAGMVELDGIMDIEKKELDT